MHEDMLTIAHWGCANTNHSELPRPLNLWWLWSKRWRTKCWQECGNIRILTHSGWEGTMTQQLWRRVLRNLNMVPRDPTTLLLRMYSRELKPGAEVHTCNPRTREAEERGLWIWVWRQSGLHNEILSQKERESNTYRLTPALVIIEERKNNPNIYWMN
jgi:hypothetical protein